MPLVPALTPLQAMRQQLVSRSLAGLGASDADETALANEPPAAGHCCWQQGGAAAAAGASTCVPLGELPARNADSFTCNFWLMRVPCGWT